MTTDMIVLTKEQVHQAVLIALVTDPVDRGDALTMVDAWCEENNMPLDSYTRQSLREEIEDNFAHRVSDVIDKILNQNLRCQADNIKTIKGATNELCF